MPPTRKVSVLTGAITPQQAKRAESELNARVEALMTWDKVAYGLGGKFDRSYLWQVAMGKRTPSRRLLLALGIVKSEKRDGIRVRMSADEAREIVERSTVPVNVKNRIRYQLGAR